MTELDLAQLPLPLVLPGAHGGQDFMIGDGNALAAAWISRWPDWPGFGLVVAGPPGCGKSHLARLFAARSQATILTDTAGLTGWLESQAESHLCLDPADSIAAMAPEALLHLIERQKAGRHSLLLTAGAAPDSWGVTLPDLLSRLRALPLARIEPPDDAMLAALLVKQCADRQLIVSPDVITWLLTRIERSHAAAVAAVAAIDHAALSTNRAVTLPLVRRIFMNALS